MSLFMCPVNRQLFIHRRNRQTNVVEEVIDFNWLHHDYLQKFMPASSYPVDAECISCVPHERNANQYVVVCVFDSTLDHSQNTVEFTLTHLGEILRYRLISGKLDERKQSFRCEQPDDLRKQGSRREG